MAEARVHNYAFRKTIAYIRDKKGKQEMESVKKTFENSTNKLICTRSPYFPSYYPLKTFVIFLQIIKNQLGDEKALTSDKKTKRCSDAGYYLYTGPEESDSPYQYLDPQKPLSEVISDFYHNLSTPSGIFKSCGTKLEKEGSKIIAIWERCEGYDEFFHYLEGVHLGIIKASKSRGVMSSRREGDTFVFEIDLID